MTINTMEDDIDLESRVKKVKRWLNNKWTDTASHFIPYLIPILRALSQGQELVLAIDGSSVGKDCMALMVSALWRNRAIPLCWLVRRAAKGHFPEQMHEQLVRQVAQLLDNLGCKCPIVLLGDGEFDGVGLQQTCRDVGWQYVLRTGRDTLIADRPEAEDLQGLDSIYPQTGQQSFFMPNMYMTKQLWGVVNVLVWHDRKYAEPLYLLTSLAYAPLAVRFYRKRYGIETLFGDIKSRGFNIHRTKVDKPETLANLLIVVCLAFILAVLAEFDWRKSPLIGRFCRKDRLDSLSVFQIGLRGIRFAVKHGICFSFQFSKNFPYAKSVRQ